PESPPLPNLNFPIFLQPLLSRFIREVKELVNVPPLLNERADRIKNKSVEFIREFFGIENDYEGIERADDLKAKGVAEISQLALGRRAFQRTST
ncbi:hypothetical protein LINGRAHAP2_LOCUS8792, partial [Linum grandiflorum]